MKPFYLLLSSACLAGLFSCKKSSTTNSIPGDVNVYVSATLHGTNGDTACYFLNNKEVALTDGKAHAGATAITVSGNDVYVAGYESNGTHLVAKYWKNGNAVSLSNGNADDIATGIAVSGNDVYVVGRETIPLLSTAIYWKNGTSLALTPNGHNGNATSIFLSGSDIYIAGYDSVAGIVTACYWKNGTIQPLASSSPYSIANSIYVNGTDVHVVGWQLSENLFTQTPVYWKNNTITPLTNSPENPGFAAAVTVSGNDVYIAGTNNYQLTLWKNGAPIVFGDGEGAQPTGVAVDGSDIFVSGQEGTARYWRDLVSITLSGVMGNAIATAVCLVKK